MSEPVGADLVAWIASHSWSHEVGSRCPGCAGDVRSIGVTHLAYTYEVCLCGSTDYDHLIERIWHARCLVDAGPAVDDLLNVLESIYRGPNRAKDLKVIASDALRCRPGTT